MARVSDLERNCSNLAASTNPLVSTIFTKKEIYQYAKMRFTFQAEKDPDTRWFVVQSVELSAVIAGKKD
jgi:hypothetical protein